MRCHSVGWAPSKSNSGVTTAVRRAAHVKAILAGMKPTIQTAPRLFIICKISMIAASITCSRSLSTKFKTIRTLVLAILFAASVVANANAGLHVVSSPQIDGGLLATAVIADNDIWAVGFSDQVPAPPVVDSTLAEHFDGTSWSIVATPSSFNGLFQAVAGAASNDVWAVGVNLSSSSTGDPLIEHWNGTSWSVVASPTIDGGGLNALAVVSSNDVWAAGTNNGNALIEHWDGTSWSVVTNSVVTSAGALSGISADASNDVWAVGRAGTGGPPILHFDGTNWSLVASHPDIEATSVTALSPTNVWAVVTVGVFFNHRTHRKAAIEHWDGTSWSIVSSPDPTKSPGLDSFLNGIAAISASDIWAVGDANTSLGGQAT